MITTEDVIHAVEVVLATHTREEVFACDYPYPLSSASTLDQLAFGLARRAYTLSPADLSASTIVELYTKSTEKALTRINEANHDNH